MNVRFWLEVEVQHCEMTVRFVTIAAIVYSAMSVGLVTL